MAYRNLIFWEVHHDIFSTESPRCCLGYISSLLHYSNIWKNSKVLVLKFWWLVKIGYYSFTCQIVYCYILFRFLFWPLTEVIKFELICYFCCAVCSNKWDQGGLIPLDFSKDQTGPKLFFGTWSQISYWPNMMLQKNLY